MTLPSYIERHRPPLSRHELDTRGFLDASEMSTSFRAWHLSLSDVSTQCLNAARL
ncbi:hypothetical protein [Georgenia alba]|uniref:AraC family transcriptional regulator n=1 Tax=Georgenia alba TaxID=2233858 RepID=A0ABW2QBK6_9MICO